MKKILISLFGILIVTSSCKKDENHLYDKVMLERVVTWAPGQANSPCEYGGYQVQRGIDRDRSGYLNDDEVWDVNLDPIVCNTPDVTMSINNMGCSVFSLFVDISGDGKYGNGDILISENTICDGQDGQDGTSVTAYVIDELDGCHTIVVFNDGVESDRFTICNGEDGVDGQDGEDGVDGQDGQDGQDGEDGQDGSSITVDIVKSESCKGYVLIIYQDGVEIDRIQLCSTKYHHND